MSLTSMREQGVSFTCAAPDQEGERPAVNTFLLICEIRQSKIGKPIAGEILQPLAGEFDMKRLFKTSIIRDSRLPMRKSVRRSARFPHAQYFGFNFRGT